MANNPIPAIQEAHGDLARFTGERLQRTDPQRFDLVKKALGEGMSIRAASRIFGVSQSTIRSMRLRDEQLGNPAALKKQLSSRMLHIVEKGLEVLEETDLLDKSTAAQVSVTIGILTEKMLLLDGQPTHITQQKKDSLNSADLTKLIENLPRSQSKVIDVSAEPEPLVCQSV